MYLAQQPKSKSHAALLISKQMLEKFPLSRVHTHLISPFSFGAHATLVNPPGGAQVFTQEHVEPSFGPHTISQSPDGTPDPVVAPAPVTVVAIGPLVVATVVSPG
jgi:hypothetical protein